MSTRQGADNRPHDAAVRDDKDGTLTVRSQDFTKGAHNTFLKFRISHVDIGGAERRRVQGRERVRKPVHARPIFFFRFTQIIFVFDRSANISGGWCPA